MIARMFSTPSRSSRSSPIWVSFTETFESAPVWRMRSNVSRDTYRETLDRIRQTGADSNVSVKLTQMGLDLDERLGVENMRAIIAQARRYGEIGRAAGRGRG